MKNKTSGKKEIKQMKDEQGETFGNKHFVIPWFRLEFDTESTEKVSEWQVLSELVRIMEQVEKEYGTISKLR